ncbi:MAG: hypothetical protein AB1607_13225 [Chloroflexota bacterium]
MSNLPRYMRILGWTAFALMWIPFCLMFVFMIMQGETEAPFEDLTSPFTISFALMFVMMFIAMGLLFGSSVVSWLLKKVAESRGERMTARILKMTPTGLTVNRSMDEVRFTLEVNYMGETLEVTTEKLLSRYSPLTYQEGMMVNVIYDPMTKLVSLAD